ncbi:NADH-quinone oxidoreductase subunit J [Candidatus Erwinia haradaeae]|uniref:NADH-quinone oxidoreductase subunit J n=1 Tax=Candidatus Erwinia haradaeae TaxID=1922217 RepID=A0A451DIT5_9GAMM|nr:NADH-quinone oxidoreductase subunit J [Candidatus Erwinia haradaeae]VFP86620.1 NADH-quinone oxidoreductase subunit J [Candidatus Erwinia haradaeae]
MEYLSYICGLTAAITTMCVVFHKQPIHALLYLIMSLLAVSGVLFSLGAYFAASLEIIIYAGAIVVLFVFTVMMLNLSKSVTRQEQNWLKLRSWIGPGLLSCLLFFIISYSILLSNHSRIYCIILDGKQVGIQLFGPYIVAVELISMLLLTGLVVGYHIGRDPRSINTIPKKQSSVTPQAITLKNQLEK